VKFFSEINDMFGWTNIKSCRNAVLHKVNLYGKRKEN